MPEPIQVLEYCYVCLLRLNTTTGRVLLRPLKESLPRTTIPLIDQRVTMCQLHADKAVKDGFYAVVETSDQQPLEISPF